LLLAEKKEGDAGRLVDNYYKAYDHVQIESKRNKKNRIKQEDPACIHFAQQYKILEGGLGRILRAASKDIVGIIFDEAAWTTKWVIM
jgi:hypothetical protein